MYHPSDLPFRDIRACLCMRVKALAVRDRQVRDMAQSITGLQTEGDRPRQRSLVRAPCEPRALLGSMLFGEAAVSDRRRGLISTESTKRVPEARRSLACIVGVNCLTIQGVLPLGVGQNEAAVADG